MKEVSVLISGGGSVGLSLAAEQGLQLFPNQILIMSFITKIA